MSWHSALVRSQRSLLRAARQPSSAWRATHAPSAATTPRRYVSASIEPARDFYEILGINRSATAAQIKRAYFQQAKQCHPDLHPANDAIAAAKFVEVSNAYECLSDADKRRFYDVYGETLESLQRSNAVTHKVEVKIDHLTVSEVFVEVSNTTGRVIGVVVAATMVWLGFVVAHIRSQSADTTPQRTLRPA